MRICVFSTLFLLGKRRVIGQYTHAFLFVSDEFIKNFSMGLDTEVGERGVPIYFEVLHHS